MSWVRAEYEWKIGFELRSELIGFALRRSCFFVLLVRSSAAYAYVDLAMRWHAAETMNLFAFCKHVQKNKGAAARG